MNPLYLSALALVSAACGGPAVSSPVMPSATPVQVVKDWIWIEAESPNRTDFPPAEQNPYAPVNATEADVLSGGKWIGAPEKRSGPLFLEYDLNAATAGTHQVYVRKFWQHGPFRWRVGTGAWTNIGNAPLLDDAFIRQFLGANWIHAGTADLVRGKNTLRIETTTNQGAAAFDAILLSKTPFTPRGKLKPGEKYNRAPAGWFAFEPDPDPFKESPIDLRFLNEKHAGEKGFIKVKGEEFVHGNTGEAVRFWAVNTGSDAVNLDKSSIDLMARSLAKQGVNLIRVHGDVWGQDFRKVDPQHVERMHYFVAAMKKEGIYTCISIYFPLWLQLDRNSGFPGYTDPKHPFSLLFFSKEFQEIYRTWWRGLLSAKNPQTGLTLANDPAVAIIEMVNEDSHFFWTFTPYENIPGAQMAILEKQFGDWLAKRYGSLPRAFQAWGGSAIRGDEAANGRAGFMPLYEVFSKKDRRAQDTATFLAINMREFYEGVQTFLKRDLGFKGLTYASNWVTADARVLGPLDKWTNTAADFMDRHGYFAGPHEGPASSYSVSPGDKFDDQSALQFKKDFSLPLWDIRYNGLPSTITEIGWTAPNRYRADLPLIAATYGLLQGTDAFYFFAMGKPSWEDTIGKFALRTPVTAGQFPATALIYRRGLVKPGPVVAEANLKLADLFALQGAPLSQPQNLDELRAKDIPAGRAGSVDRVSAVDPLAFTVGKVAINFTTDTLKSSLTDITRFIDRASKVSTSATGELKWDWGTGLVAVNAPGAQGVTGFLSARPFEGQDVSIKSDMHYGAIVVVALDGQPLRTSKRMMLQVMSEEMAYGWDAPGTGMRAIKSVGSAPIVVKNFSGSVTLKRPDASGLKVTPLDANGYRIGGATTGGSITLRPNVLYYVIEVGA